MLLARYMRDDGWRSRAPVDATGIALLIVTVSCLQYVLDQGQRDDWFSDSSIQMCTFLAASAGAAFVWRELRVAQPIVDLRVLRAPAVVAGLAIAGTFAGIIFPVLLLLPPYTVENLGFTSTGAGILIGLRALPVLVLTIPVAMLVALPRFDLRWSIGGGLALAGIASLWLGARLTTDSSMGTFVLPLLAMGTGAAFVYSPLLVATMRAVAPEAAAKASSFIVLFFQLGGSIGSAAIVAFLDQRLQFHQAVLAAEATLSRLPVTEFLKNGTLAQLSGLVNSQAAALSYADAFFVTGVLALIVSPGALLLARRRA